MAIRLAPSFLSSMAINPKTICFLFVLSISLTNLQSGVHGNPQVPCYFIFGDSFSDDGNNNNLVTTAKVNYLPYGIDFPNGPTGRFSNGRNKIDVIVQRLGFDGFIPPYATSGGPEILKGVNYASGAAGIRDETAKHVGERISLNRQILRHGITVANITRLVGNNKIVAIDYLNKCLYSVSIGTNDYILNYFVPRLYPTSSLYTPAQYADVLIQEYSLQIVALYKLGARKMALFGLNPLGCCPLGKSLDNTNTEAPCSEKVNNAVHLFNDRLKELVDRLNLGPFRANFTYINTYEIVNSTFSSSAFKVKNETCCPTNDMGLCTPLKTPCPKRDGYVYWDTIHFTEAAYSVIGERAYKAQTELDVHPYDISQLVQLN